MLVAGCTDFIAKPFGSDDLLNLLKKQLHLELVYGDAEESKSPGPRPLSADDLRGLPAAELATLHRLAIVCDELELVKWLETQDCLAPAAKEALAQLIKDYQFEEIQKITDSLMR
jgi:DNA-binding response OmpR family regulator